MSALLGLAEDAVRKALAAGADEAEAYVWDTSELQAGITGAATSCKDSHTGGIGVRALRAGAAAFAAAAPAGPAEAARVGAQAARLAAMLPSTKARLPEPLARTPARGPAWSPALAGLGAEEGLRLVKGAMRELRAGKGGRDLRYASASLRRNRFRYAVFSSRGVAVEDRGVRAAFEVECRLRARGQERTGTALRVARTALRTRGVGGEALGRARDLLGAKPLQEGVYDVVLDGEAGALLCQLLDPALRGLLVAQGRSLLAGKLGQAVASAPVTVRDGPAAGGPRAQRWDDEGTPALDATLIDRGELKGYLLDNVSATKLDLPRTGHGLRGDEERHRRPPQGLPMGFALQPGSGTFEDLAAEVRDGVLVRGGFMGLASLDQVTGDFSVIAPSAFRVRRGEVAHALTPTTIAGSLPGLLQGIQRVGADSIAHLHGTTPSMLVGGLTCAS